VEAGVARGRGRDCQGLDHHQVPPVASCATAVDHSFSASSPAPIALYIVFVIFALRAGVLYGADRWQGYSPSMNFVGAANFTRLSHDTMAGSRCDTTCIW